MGWLNPDDRRVGHREYMRMRYQTDPEHREKHKARVKVAKAVRSGRLIRQPCQICGSEKSQAHHEDYNRPLDVLWYCRKCHIRIAHGDIWTS